MKKLLSISLILTLLLFSTSCAAGSTEYKVVTFKHAEILQEQLELTIPNEWICEEICHGDISRISVLVLMIYFFRHWS